MGQSDVQGRRTLVGSGWLREAPGNVRALMRRCMMVPLRQVPGLPVTPVSHRASSYPSLPQPRAFPSSGTPSRPPPQPMPVPSPRPTPRAGRAASPEAEAVPGAGAVPWWDDPVTVGALLVVMPPVGLATLWTSRHFSREARQVITAMMGLMLALSTGVAVALVRR